MKQRKKSSRGRWVVKIGSSLLTENGLGLATHFIGDWVAQIAELRKQGIDFVVVSSGSIAEGCSRLGWTSRPSELHRLQAAAAVGQMGLVQAWESQFKEFDAHTAQVLLVGEDVSDRNRYLNARKTINTLLALNVIPVVNENDTIATDEIRFGDNDRLAALVANLIYADRLVIMTDQPGMYSADPSKNPDAQLIRQAKASDPALLAAAGPSGGALGRGGMQTKVTSARQAATSGTDTYIVSGLEPQVLLRLADGEAIGTHLQADRKPAVARKQWIAGHARTRGRLWLDDGAVRAITAGKSSLLPIGVTRCEGRFTAGDVVSCLAPDDQEIARGLVGFNAAEVQEIMGLSSKEIAARNVSPRDKELIHLDNLILL